MNNPSQYQAFLGYLSKRDIPMLDLLLDKEVYSKVPKVVFMKTLEEALSEFGDDEELSFCEGTCDCDDDEPTYGHTGISCIGSKRFMNLIIDIENDRIEDINPCFCFNCRRKLTGKQIYMQFWLEDTIDFVPTPEHSFLLHLCDKAVNELKQEGPLSIKFIENWLDKQKELFDEIISPGADTKLFIFTECYYDLSGVTNFLELKSEMENSLYEYHLIKQDENKILDWLIKCENFLGLTRFTLRIICSELKFQNEVYSFKKRFYLKADEMDSILHFYKVFDKQYELMIKKYLKLCAQSDNFFPNLKSMVEKVRAKNLPFKGDLN